MTQRLAHAQAPDSNRGHSKSRKQCPEECHGGVWGLNIDSRRKADRKPSGVLRISSDGDDGRIFNITQAAQTRLLIYKRMYENKQNTS